MQRDMCHMPPQSLLCVLVALAFSGCNVAQKVTQVQSTGSSQWGEVTLHCSYETSEYFYVILWYKQLFSGEMVFLIYQTSFDTQNQRNSRYSVVFQKSLKSISLVISASQPEDSGTYFCALSEQWHIGGIRATDKLVFGQGTQVTVEPKSQPPAKPSVFIMKNGTNVACLVKDFYPKEVTISLRSSKKIVEFDPAIVISPSGKYSAVKLGQYGDSNSVTCSVQHNSETVHSTDFEPYANSFNNEKLPEPENDTQISEPCYGPRVTVHTEKVNMMSLTVLGLRLLFAKTIAINFLLTVKLFF